MPEPAPNDKPIENPPAVGSLKPSGGNELAPAVGSLGMVNKRMIVWGPDGVPRPSSVPALTTQGISDLSAVALSLPYKIRPMRLIPPIAKDASAMEKARYEQEAEAAQREYEDELEFEGMTNAEVMIIRMARAGAYGDEKAASTLLDRALGKAKQQIETKNVNVTYADVLKEKAARAAAAAAASRPADVIDVVVESVKKDDLEGL